MNPIWGPALAHASQFVAGQGEAWGLGKDPSFGAFVANSQPSTLTPQPLVEQLKDTDTTGLQPPQIGLTESLLMKGALAMLKFRDYRLFPSIAM